MKKKVKLFATIASLCLAVCLMAFGVWAASTATLGVSSSVSYTVSGNVHVAFDVMVEYTSTENHVSYTAASGSTATAETGKNTWETITQTPSEGDKNSSLGLGTYQFNVGAEKDDYVKYTIKVTNLGKYDAKLTVTDLPAADTNKSIHISREGTGSLTTANSAETATVAKNNGTFTIVVIYSLNDVATDCSALTFAPKLVVTPQAD